MSVLWKCIEGGKYGQVKVSDLLIYLFVYYETGVDSGVEEKHVNNIYFGI